MDGGRVESVCCVCGARQKGHRRVGPSVWADGRTGRREEKRSVREEKRAQSGEGDADDGRIIHSDAQKKEGECALCVCVCVCVCAC